MKAILHKQNENFRVVQRGMLFYVQTNDGSQGSRDRDPWYDVGHPRNDCPSAVGAMYTRIPLTQAA